MRRGTKLPGPSLGVPVVASVRCRPRRSAHVGLRGSWVSSRVCPRPKNARGYTPAKPTPLLRAEWTQNCTKTIFARSTGNHDMMSGTLRTQIPTEQGITMTGVFMSFVAAPSRGFWLFMARCPSCPLRLQYWDLFSVGVCPASSPAVKRARATVRAKTFRRGVYLVHPLDSAPTDYTGIKPRHRRHHSTGTAGFHPFHHFLSSLLSSLLPAAPTSYTWTGLDRLDAQATLRGGAYVQYLAKNRFAVSTITVVGLD